jgi:hypothetical protein
MSDTEHEAQESIEPDGWNEYKRLVLAELRRISAGMVEQETTSRRDLRRIHRRISKLNRSIDQRVASVEKDVTQIKTKAALIGAAASLVIAALLQVVVKWLSFGKD